MDIGIGEDHVSPSLSVEAGRVGVIADPAGRFVEHLSDVLDGMERLHRCPSSSPSRVMRSMTLQPSPPPETGSLMGGSLRGKIVRKA